MRHRMLCEHNAALFALLQIIEQGESVRSRCRVHAWEYDVSLRFVICLYRQLARRGAGVLVVPEEQWPSTTSALSPHCSALPQYFGGVARS